MAEEGGLEEEEEEGFAGVAGGSAAAAAAVLLLLLEEAAAASTHALRSPRSLATFSAATTENTSASCSAFGASRRGLGTRQTTGE